MIVLSHHMSLLSYMYYFQASNLHLPAAQQKQAKTDKVVDTIRNCGVSFSIWRNRDSNKWE